MNNVINFQQNTLMSFLEHNSLLDIRKNKLVINLFYNINDVINKIGLR